MGLTSYARSMRAAQFVRGFTGASRHFAARLVNETRGCEQTEAYLCEVVAPSCGVSAREREDVIGAALDAGLVRSTIVQFYAAAGERRFTPALAGQ